MLTIAIIYLVSWSIIRYLATHKIKLKSFIHEVSEHHKKVLGAQSKHHTNLFLLNETIFKFFINFRYFYIISRNNKGPPLVAIIATIFLPNLA